MELDLTRISCTNDRSIAFSIASHFFFPFLLFSKHVWCSNWMCITLDRGVAFGGRAQTYFGWWLGLLIIMHHVCGLQKDVLLLKLMVLPIMHENLIKMECTFHGRWGHLFKVGFALLLIPWPRINLMRCKRVEALSYTWLVARRPCSLCIEISNFM